MTAGDKESVVIGGYTITLVERNNSIIGAIIVGSRLSRPIYIAKAEKVKVNLPKTVKKYLRKMGFNVE